MMQQYLSGEEDEDVPDGLGDVDLEHRHHAGLQVVRLGSLEHTTTPRATHSPCVQEQVARRTPC